MLMDLFLHKYTGFVARFRTFNYYIYKLISVFFFQTVVAQHY